MKIEELRKLIIHWEQCEANGLLSKGRSKEFKKRAWININTPSDDFSFSVENVGMLEKFSYSFHDFGCHHVFKLRKCFVSFMAKQGYEYECDIKEHPKFKGIAGPMISDEDIRYETWEMNDLFSI